MALSGVREMSLIATPPVDRLAVRTFVGPWDGVVLREAIQREMFRGGQVFVVCPRIDDMQRVYDRITKLAPEARVISAHGRMPANELDQVMTRFADGEADILLAPDLEAGNMIAKQLIYLAGAQSAGVAVGARVPIILTSRADGVVARLASCALASYMVHHGRKM